jgi:hypothetical protein
MINGIPKTNKKVELSKIKYTAKRKVREVFQIKSRLEIFSDSINANKEIKIAIE